MTIRVKQLEWADSYGVMRAETPFGTYMARGNILTFNRIDSIGPDPMGRAQADFERRILSVIEEDRDDHDRELIARAESPDRGFANSVDFLQRQGRDADIISEAISTYDEWMLDDDFEAMPVLERIISRMKERRSFSVDAAALRAEVLEQAAQKVESLWAYRTCAEVAAAIRAMKGGEG